MNDKIEMKQLIIEYIDEEECARTKNTDIYNCENCNCIEECFKKAKIEIKKSKHLEHCCGDCDDNDIFAESINYGGYKTEDDFWNELFE